MLSEGTRYGSGWLDGYQGSYAEYNAALRESFLKLVAAGDKHVFYVFGEDLYANDTHAVDIDSPTAAGCHPTDVGHYRIARYYSAVLPRWMAGETNEVNARAVRAEHAIYLAARRGLPPSPLPPAGAQRHVGSHSRACSRLRLACSEQRGNTITCLDCAKAHAAVIASDLECTPHHIQGWCLSPPPAPVPMTWTKAADLGPLRGIPSFPPSLPMGSPFHRFPAAAQQDLTAEMWQMSTWGSGTFVRFDSNASALAINFTLTVPYTEYETLMPIDGTSGFDIYAHDTQSDAWLFVSNCLSAFEASRGNLTMVCHLDSAHGSNATAYPGGGGSVRYMLYLPLYNGVSQLSIGHGGGGVIKPGTGTAIDEPAAPVVWFGTSITQGGASSRPGAHFINGISRSLGRPVLNWGFAGPGQMQLAVAKYLVQIEPSPTAVIIDCLPDMTAAMVTQRTAPLVAYLRANGLATTPIVLVEGTNYTNQWLVPSSGPGVPATWEQPAKRAALRAEYQRLVAAGDTHLHYVSGSALLGQEDNDLESPLVGGVHPSDLGEERLRGFWVKQLPTILAAPGLEQP